MKIIGPDELIFGVDNKDQCVEFLTDYGLDPSSDGTRFAALDNTALVVLDKDDPRLPPAMATGTTLRQTVWGVEDQATLDAIEAELSMDRTVAKAEDGTLSCKDDAGFEIAFRVTRRTKLDMPAEMINTPGAKPGRPPNVLGIVEGREPKPHTLSHVVYFVPDLEVCSKFYIERLGFIVTDKFTNTGPFLRPQSNFDHHVLFMIQVPAYMQGLEHLAFHMQGPTDLMLAGTAMVEKGYESFWGPGRHKFASNWFWYFNSPMGVHVEYDADMDLHDGEWVERETVMSAEAAQAFLFERSEKWTPSDRRKKS